MDENNTTPEPKVPDDEGTSKPEGEDFVKKPKNFNFFDKNIKSSKQFDDYHEHKTHWTQPTPIVKPEQPSSYDEIVEDLIDIIAKLLKELRKRK